MNSDELLRIQKDVQAQVSEQKMAHTTHATFRQTKPVPPVSQWQPKHVGSMALTIKADGSWWHEGARFQRQSLVDLFATVLWRETMQVDNKHQVAYFLKTPVEQLQITVEDAPLLAVDVRQLYHDGKRYLEFTTQTGDVVVADAQHPIFMRKYNGELRPYVTVRYVDEDENGNPVGEMDALIHRNTFLHLIELGTLTERSDGQVVLELVSGDATFTLGMASA